MIEFHKIWKEQCRAALNIREEYGSKKALGYLIGEKLINFLQASDTNPKFAQELPEFLAEIKRIFQPSEITEFLESIPKTGALAHCCTDDEIEVFHQAGALPNDPQKAVEVLQLYYRAKELLIR